MRFLILFCLVSIVSCSTKKPTHSTNETFSFLALGDSYTIGEAVDADQRWPAQLATRLIKDSIKVNPVIVAKTGWTTDELIAGIVKSDVSGTYDLVSLLIGVNNQYRGYPIDQYEREFKELLDAAIKFAGGNPYQVMVISIPDYGVTPFVSEKMLDKSKIAKELDSYNAIAEKIAMLRDVKFISITEGSKEAKNDSSLITVDGLHPSGKMYAQWVDSMYANVYDNLSAR